MRPLRVGRKLWGKSELDGWLEWAVYPPNITDEEIYDEWPQCYSGPGQFFSGKAYTQRAKKLVVVTQRQGYDV